MFISDSLISVEITQPKLNTCERVLYGNRGSWDQCFTVLVGGNACIFPTPRISLSCPLFPSGCWPTVNSGVIWGQAKCYAVLNEHTRTPPCLSRSYTFNGHHIFCSYTALPSYGHIVFQHTCTMQKRERNYGMMYITMLYLQSNVI